MLPKLSIITVCYNSQKTIKDTIESVLNQSYKNYEYLIIDGQSTDQTLNIIKEYEPKFDGRLKWISEKDKGIYNAMNKGIKMATGDLIGIINSDDWYANHAFQVIVDNYTGNEWLIHGKMNMMLDANTLESTRGNKLDYRKIKEACIIYHPTCFITKKTYNKIGLYDEKYKIAADYDLFYRIINQNGNIKFINELIASMRIGGASMQNEWTNVKEDYVIRKNNSQSHFIAVYYTIKQCGRYIILKLLNRL